MTDRNDRSTERRPAEGVRIIGADEAQAALEAGQAAGRLTEEELRYGDVPPTPSGPRPVHRFPLPESVPAEAVPRPPVAPVSRPPLVRAPRAAEAGGGARPAEQTGPPAAEPGSVESASGEVGPDEGVVNVRRVAGVSSVTERSQPGVRGGRRPLGGDDVGDDAEIDLNAPDPVVERTRSVRASAGRPGEPRTRGRAAPPPPLPDEGHGGPAGYDGGAWSPAGPGVPAGGGAHVGGSPAPGGETPAAVFEEADPTGRVPVFDPGGVGGEEDDGAGGTAGSRGVPLAAEPPPVDLPGTGLRWATPIAEPSSSAPTGEPGPGVAGSWPTPEVPPPMTSEPPVAAGGDLWDGLPGPDDPTTITPPVPSGPSGADERAPVADEWVPVADEWSPATPGQGGISVWGGSDLPHWTEPPTGEVPTSLVGLGSDDPGGVAGGGARWRQAHGDWDDGSEVGDLAGDDLPLGALDQDRSEESDLFSFDEDFERLEAGRTAQHAAVPPDRLGPDGLDSSGPLGFDESIDDDDEDLVGAGVVGGTPGAGGTGTRRSGRGGPPGRGASRGGSGATRRRPPELGGERQGPVSSPDLSSRLGVGVGLAVVLVATYVVGSGAMLGLVALGLLGAAAEGFTMLRESSGFRPATLIGLLATAGLVLGAWWKGEGALPLVLAVATVATILWYLLGVSDARPLANVMATITVVVWVGLLGSFGSLLLRAPHGRGLLFGVVVTVVLADVVAYFGGRSFGHRKLAPQVSPGKTVEGFVAGGVAAVVVGAVVGHVVPGWGGAVHGVLLGLVVAVFAPIGDLFESLIKRDLDIKDSGRLLAGHGGLLDRFDSVILALPAAYYLAVAMHLAS